MSNAVETMIRRVHELHGNEPEVVVGCEHGVWFAEIRYGYRAWGPTLEHALGSLAAQLQASRAASSERAAMLRATAERAEASYAREDVTAVAVAS